MYKHLLKHADAVCLDVDSTVSLHEGIDELAKWCGVSVSKSTQQTMNNRSVSFRDSLRNRLNIIRPSKHDVETYIQHNPPVFSHGVHELVETLQEKQVDVYLVSGGFRSLIEPFAQSLSVPETHVFANTILFHEDGTYMGFDTNEMTSRPFRGKVDVINHLQAVNDYEHVVMIGDGATDLETKGVASLFIGYGGVNVRDLVKNEADWFVTNFEDITNAFLY